MAGDFSRVSWSRAEERHSPTQITELLKRVHEGDAQALNAVIPLVYDELKKLAAAHLRRESKEPIQTTALVHEAFLRLAGGQHPSYENRSHFFGIASRLMRQILVEMARSRATEKRNFAAEVQLTGTSDRAIEPDESLLAIDEALERLSLSVHSVRHQLRLAQALLHKEMSL